MNVYTFTGRLARDCETRYTQSGMAICSFTVAVDYGFGENKGTNWIRCSLFGKRAEGRLPQYLVKGTQVAVSGELRVRDYTDNDGNKRTSVDASVNELDLIGGRQDGGAQGGGVSSYQQQGGGQQGGGGSSYQQQSGGQQGSGGSSYQQQSGGQQGGAFPSQGGGAAPQKSSNADPFASAPDFGDVPVDDDIPF